MKLISLFTVTTLLILGLCGSAQAQQETLIGNNVNSVSGYGGPEFMFTGIDGQSAAVFGGFGAALFNGKFAIGGGGFGLASNVNYRNTDAFGTDELDYDFGYGGVYLEYHFTPNKLVHFTVASLVGGGGIELYNNTTRREEEELGVFVMDPRIRAEVNLTSFLRVSVAGGYRLVAGNDTDFVQVNDFSAPFGSVALKFGWFE